MARPARSSIAASRAVVSLARTLASASPRASVTSPTTLSSATASIAARSSSTRGSSAAVILDHLFVVLHRLLLLDLRPIPLHDLLAPVLLADHFLALPRSGEARDALQPFEPRAKLLVLLLELLGARTERRVGFPPVDPHLLRPLDRRDQQAQLDRQQLDVEQVDLDVPRDDDPLVEHPLQDVGEVRGSP